MSSRPPGAAAVQGRKATRKGGDSEVEQEQGGDKARSETASSLHALGMAEVRRDGLMVRPSRARQSRAGPHGRHSEVNGEASAAGSRVAGLVREQAKGLVGACAASKAGETGCVHVRANAWEARVEATVRQAWQAGC